MTTIAHKKRIAIANLAQGGGDGKTWTSQLVTTIFQLLNLPLRLFDADQGNRALSILESGTQAIDIMAEPDLLLEKVMGRVQHDEAMVLDLGANTLADSVNFLNFLFRLGFALKDRDYAVHALWIVSTNKIGAAEGLQPIARQYEGAYSPLWVFNDRDGSGTMPEGFQPDIVIPNLDPGFVKLINDEKGFMPLIINGKENYQLSCNYIAAYVWKFANQQGIRRIYGDAAIDSLKQILDRDVPRLTPFWTKTPLTDEQFLAEANRAEIARAVFPFLDNVDEAIAALLEYKRTKY